jgi:hypothetical protein
MANRKSLDMVEEFPTLDFNSARLERRFIRTMETLSEQPGKSIWGAVGSRSRAKPVYRMLTNENFDRDKLIIAQREAVLRRMAECGGVILALQDTTSINYGTYRKTEGMGYIDDKTIGVNVHSCLAITPEGQVLGVLHQLYYNHKGPKDGMAGHDHGKTLPQPENEGYRWIETLEKSTAFVPEGVKIINVCDRGGDVYEFFERALELNAPFLIRIACNRMTSENERMLERVRNEPCLGRIEVTITQAGRDCTHERQAVLQMRYASYRIKRPRTLNEAEPLHDTIDLQIIHAREENPPAGKEPIEWFLVTGESVNSLEKACKYVGYYAQRLNIERFYYVLKNRCTVGKLQERSIDKLTALIFMYSVIASRILNGS